MKTADGQETCQVITATALITKISRTKEEIDPMWILCDNESTVGIVKNDAIITNIKKTDNPIEITGIGGQPKKVTLEGDLIGYGTVHYHPEVAANILSFYKTTKRFKNVTYDNTKKDAFIVRRDDGSNMEFIPSKDGLYHYDFNISIKRRIAMESAKKTLIVNTVEDLKRIFSKSEIEGAENARRLYIIVGRPSQKNFENMIRRGKLVNNTVTIQDYRNALQIYGEDLGVLKGKTVQSKPKSLQVQIMNKPQPQDIVLIIDIMKFTGLYFLVTVSRGILFITTTLLPDRKKNTIMNALLQVFNIYKNRGHCVNDVEFKNSEDTIHTVLADNEFKILQEEVEEMGVNVSIVTKNEHVPEVERQNRVIKERARCIIQTLPYSKVPRKIWIALIQYVVFWLNDIPKENQLLSPREMIKGEQILH